MLRGQPGALWRCILGLEVVTHLFHGDPLDAFLCVDVLDDPVDSCQRPDQCLGMYNKPLKHQQRMWVA